MHSFAWQNSYELICLRICNTASVYIYIYHCHLMSYRILMHMASLFHWTSLAFWYKVGDTPWHQSSLRPTQVGSCKLSCMHTVRKAIPNSPAPTCQQTLWEAIQVSWKTMKLWYVGYATSTLQVHLLVCGIAVIVQTTRPLKPTNIAPEIGSSQKEINLPTIHFQVRAVSFREGNHGFLHHRRSDVLLLRLCPSSAAAPCIYAHSDLPFIQNNCMSIMHQSRT